MFISILLIGSENPFYNGIKGTFWLNVLFIYHKSYVNEGYCPPKVSPAKNFLS